ncbi:hypothetical protein [Capnocytophaga catalasegens]|uniref:Lipoprotein n=1 Tax=Capnocytophaga catalasegens TaxID=1004260 RepID=A0AAV5ASS0_9FLAO|nr:hypothetical protein [Capnocytophaga catalasegens]GIZ14926.1 hypothetical protein RCZ03_09260 [Capnocytophaga catalasegens]GJM49305.1 hypothetical protein RCZ15_02800 [Capnocytophaga catalasegens]GJM52456.1 hypothetical protein RCZ16_07730 [Capnocytophaga catalasegens]
MKRILTLAGILILALVSCGKSDDGGTTEQKSLTGGTYTIKATVTDGILTEAKIQMDMYSDDSKEIKIPEAEIKGKTQWSREYSFKRTTYVSVWAETNSDNSTLILELLKDGKVLKKETKVGKERLVGGVSIL